MTGTPSQIEWAQIIRPLVAAEFDRVALALENAMASQSDPDRQDTRAILAILSEIRATVLARDDAGYYIRDWRELGSQVRRMLAGDPAFQAIQANREARKRALQAPTGASYDQHPIETHRQGTGTA